MRSQVSDSGLREQFHLRAHAGVERLRVTLRTVIRVRHSVQPDKLRSRMVPRPLGEAHTNIVEHLRGGQLVEVVRPALRRQVSEGSPSPIPLEEKSGPVRVSVSVAGSSNASSL